MLSAFIHLLFEGFDMFADPCIGESLAFEPAAPAITMAGVIIVFSVDFLTVRAMSCEDSQSALPSSSPSHGTDVATAHGQKEGSTPLELSVEEKKKHWEVNMLEGGTVFHSFIVGLTVGAQSGNGFVGLGPFWRLLSLNSS